MQKSYAEFYKIAEIFTDEKKYWKALAIYNLMLDAEPKDFRLRLKIAELFLLLKEPKAAFKILETCAFYFLHSGYPLHLILTLNRLKEAFPTNNLHKAILKDFAKLYSVDSQKVDPDGELPPYPMPNLRFDFHEKLIKEEPDIKLLQRVAEICLKLKGHKEQLATLPPIPILSRLKMDEFTLVVERIAIERFSKNITIITEGSIGNTFYLVIEGKLRVEKHREGCEPTELAILSETNFFGEIALITNSPRLASVTTIESSLLLTISRDIIQDIYNAKPSVKRILWQFCGNRLLKNLLLTNFMFRDLDKEERIKLLRRFKSVEFEEKEVIIEEGETGEGLYIILNGSALVTKRTASDETITLATLKNGDIIGEISLIQTRYTTATVTATIHSLFLFLPREDFDEVTVFYPHVLIGLHKLCESRMTDTQKFMKLLQSTDLDSDTLEPTPASDIVDSKGNIIII